MANKVTSIVLKEKQLGKIKATVKEERDIFVEGSRVPCRIFTASSPLHPDFEIIVPNLRNSERFEGRKEIELVHATVVPNAKRNNIGTASRSLELQVFAQRLLVVL